jgi:hypothetical protein
MTSFSGATQSKSRMLGVAVTNAVQFGELPQVPKCRVWSHCFRAVSREGGRAVEGCLMSHGGRGLFRVGSSDPRLAGGDDALL